MPKLDSRYFRRAGTEKASSVYLKCQRLQKICEKYGKMLTVGKAYFSGHFIYFMI